jgi:hypothetical protein
MATCRSGNVKNDYAVCNINYVGALPLLSGRLNNITGEMQ